MKKRWLSLISGVTLLVGCTASDPLAPTPPRAGEISLGTSGVISRAPIESDGSNVPQQDMNEIQVIRGTDGPSATGFVTSSVASTASITAFTTTMKLATRQYFRDYNTDAHFMAFYPKADGFASGVASWTLDGIRDIMVTAPVKATYNVHGTSVNLSFVHLLARVDIRLVAADAASAELFGKLKKAVITVPSEVELKLADNGTSTFAKKESSSATVTLDFGEVPLTTDGVTTNSGFMIFPEAADLSQVSLQFENPNHSETIYPLSDVTLQAGHKTLIVITVTGRQIDLTVSVEPWKPATEGTGPGDVGLGDPTP